MKTKADFDFQFHIMLMRFIKKFIIDKRTSLMSNWSLKLEVKSAFRVQCLVSMQGDLGAMIQNFLQM
jgi:hypothetical protein